MVAGAGQEDSRGVERLLATCTVHCRCVKKVGAERTVHVMSDDDLVGKRIFFWT